MRTVIDMAWLAIVFGCSVLCTLVPGWAAAHRAADHQPGLLAVQFSSTAGATGIRLTFERWAEFRAPIDPSTGCLTLAFPSLSQGSGALMGQSAGLVRAYRMARGEGDAASLVFDLNHPAVIQDVHEDTGDAGGPAHAIITLGPGDAIAMQAVADLEYGPMGYRPSPNTRPAIAHPAPTPPEPRLTVPMNHKRVIVIDAGHGGIDPGADSVAGYHEKEITLATARVLARVLERTGRYSVVLTRDQDIYLKLHERVDRARAAHGDLFVSLHADSVGDRRARGTRGASLYTLSEKASDAESDRYAQRENRADAIGGAGSGDQSDDVAGILVDLTVRETVNDGNRLANMLARSLEQDGVSLLPRTPHRAAGFAVLKSPDIPSVLVEMGYLSNIADARALADPSHQLRVAKGLADGIDRYFAWVEASRS